MYHTLLALSLCREYGVFSHCQGHRVTWKYRTLLGVSKEFVLIGCVLRKWSVFILYFTLPHLFNENKLRTHDTTLGQARCGTYLSNENLGFIHANNIPRGLRAIKMTSKERFIYAKCKAWKTVQKPIGCFFRKFFGNLFFWYLKNAYICPHKSTLFIN